MIAQARLIYVMIPVERKNDTNTPAVLEVWVLGVGSGLGQMEKEPVKSQQCFLIPNKIFIMGSPKLFMATKLSLINLI